MSISDLKLELILQISNLNDKVKLEEILELLKFQTESSIYEVSEEEELAIKEAKNQISSNNVLSNSVVNEEMNEWLKK
ncbi:hypothetical protein ACTS91_05330 [Empedobacter falsenii]|uniref:hypothetical protein n=1 Tax=Empedobacter TaxID=59734 RepID=UPI000570730C|nr:MULTISPECIES: hypothetical protein [Empedobacter]MDH0659990.1 hypothetical protein [Empedobacter sp. GD03865]MDM1040885.1 hypothetical protein [Empedobacter brevis]MDM1134466.1 hypothetical protein [Empedobacter sp. R750]HBX63150.1 hypothetical protein [Flavobacteriaceae bacterium]